MQPGVTNLAVSEAAAPYGLYYAPDPSSQVACSVGGNVAENSGGVHCLKYGLTVHNVLAVKLVTMDGELLTLGSETGEAPGLNLLAAVIGSEGLLGVVVEVTVRLAAAARAASNCCWPRSTTWAVAPRPSVSVIAAGIVPAGLEMMDAPAIKAAEAFARCGYPLDAQALLLCEVDGLPADVDDELGRARALLEAAGATSVRVASGRRRAPPHVVGPQVGLPRGGSARPRLLLHGRHDPPPPPGGRAGADRGAVDDLSASTWPTSFTRATATCTR